MERNQGVAGDCGAAYGLTRGIAVTAETPSSRAGFVLSGKLLFGGRLETQSSFDLEVSRRFCGAKSFNDPEYQPLKALRQRVRESEIVSVEGA